MRSKHGEIKERKNQDIGDVLCKVIPKIKIVFLYGLIPADTDTGRSDIGLMMIGGISFKKLTLVLKEVEGILNRELNPTLFSVGEFEDDKKATIIFLLCYSSSCSPSLNGFLVPSPAGKEEPKKP